MTIERCIEVLTLHNDWRRGAEIPMLEPKEIGEAIEFAIAALLECAK